VFVMLVLCYTMMSLSSSQYIQQCSGTLIVFSASITVAQLCDPPTVSDIALGMKNIWLFAEVFLFTLAGTSISFNPTNGPLYGQRGFTGSMVADVVSVLFAATACRLMGIGLVVAVLYRYLPPHRQTLQYCLPFWLTCYIFQLPKATVQATMGTFAHNSKLIPGPQGFNQALIIAQTTALSVLIFGPIGSLLTTYVAAPMSLYLRFLDKEAGWNDETRTYNKAALERMPSAALQMMDIYPSVSQKGGDDAGGAGGVEGGGSGEEGTGADDDDMDEYGDNFVAAEDLDEHGEEIAVGPRGERLYEPPTIGHLLSDVKKTIERSRSKSQISFERARLGSTESQRSRDKGEGADELHLYHVPHSPYSPAGHSSYASHNQHHDNPVPDRIIELTNTRSPSPPAKIPLLPHSENDDNNNV
jgi:hypothetical protein